MLRCYTVTGSKMQNTTSYLKLIPNETVLFQYSYIEVTTVTAHKELMFLNISKVLIYTLTTNCTYIFYF